jgi:hypothetical protein
MGELRNVFGIVFGKPEGRGPLEKPWRRREDNNNMDTEEIGYEGADQGLPTRGPPMCFVRSA